MHNSKQYRIVVPGYRIVVRVAIHLKRVTIEICLNKQCEYIIHIHDLSLFKLK